MKNDGTTQELDLQEKIWEYIDYCWDRKQLRPSTMRTKKNACERFYRAVGVKYLHELDDAAFDRFVDSMGRRGISSNSKRGSINTIMPMLKYFKAMGYYTPINIPNIIVPKKSKVSRIFFLRSELIRPLELADEFQWLLIKITFDTGMRITELTNLERGNFAGRRVNYIGKGLVDRESYISEECLTRLVDYMRKHNITGRLWLTENGRPFRVNEIRQIMREVFLEVSKEIENRIIKYDDIDGSLSKLAEKYRKFHPHSLRHSFATDKQLQGASIAEIQQMLGHQDQKITEAYLHGFEGKLESLFDKYDGGVSSPDHTGHQQNIIQQIIDLAEDLKNVSNMEFSTAKQQN
jgi:site-specific recombinase XerD